MKQNHIIYPQLSYQIMGVLFNVHNKLGPAYQEKYYQRAIEAEFNTQQVPFEREKLIQLQYQSAAIGKYYLDFVIENKIILETKAIDFFKRKDFRQVLAYLDVTNLKLAILTNFNTPKLTYKRIVNPKASVANDSES